jgi:hypothetical protein
VPWEAQSPIWTSQTTQNTDSDSIITEKKEETQLASQFFSSLLEVQINELVAQIGAVASISRQEFFLAQDPVVG